MGSPVDIGIDLGTTFSVLAVAGCVELTKEYGAGIYLDHCDVTIIPTPYGEPTFPSVMVSNPVDQGSFLFGSDALRSIEDGSVPVMFSKRKIGTMETMHLSTRSVTAKDVAKSFLTYLKECAEKALGSPVRRAIVTHPAYFDRAAVEETRQAAMEAGFDMENPDQMLMEPVAAALAYTRGDKRDPLRVITYDLGGGTFDVTCLERNCGVIEMRSFDGDHLLGGYNFDRVLVQWILEKLASRGVKILLDEENPEDRSTIAKLLQFTERVKISLAEAKGDDDRVQVRGRKVLVDKNGREVPIDERITRKEFTSLIEPYLDRTIKSTRAAIKKADLDENEIDIILLVGGSSRGPWVADALRKAFPDIQDELFEPDLCVAAGAALYTKMVLPPLVQQDSGLELLLDVPESMSIENVTVHGRLMGAASSCEGMVAVLKGDGLDSEMQASLDENGSFTFEELYLEELGTNRFRIRIADSGGEVLVSHDFTIRYDPASTETSSVVSVLPRALFIETVDGMVAIAEAGVSLPVRCEQSFQRQNNNPNITLKLYQDRTPIGEIRVENIPPEGGIGSYVDLKLKVNERGQVLGTAVISKTSGETVLSAPVEIHIKPQAIPARQELEHRFSQVKTEWESIRSQKDDVAKDLSKVVNARIRHIEILYGQVPLERQEIAAVLDELEQIISPPKDDMQPTMAEFLKKAEECRDAFTKLEQFLLKKESEHEQGTNSKKSSRIRRMHDQIKQRKKKMEQLLEDLEQRARDAHENRDRREWARINETTSALMYEAQEKSKEKADKEEVQPAFISKIMLTMEINKLITRLNENAEKLKREGRFNDWNPEIRRIFSGLSIALKEASAISEDLSGEQALAMCRQIYATMLNPLIRALDNIGVDISKAGKAVDDIGQMMQSTSFTRRMGGEVVLDGEIASTLLAAGHTSIFEAVLNDSADLNQQDDDGHTPLMIAALQGDVALTSTLLSKGARIDLRNKLGRTVLMLAKNRQVAEKLVEAGSDVNDHDSRGVTALMLAALNGETDQVQYLVEKGSDMEARWEIGQTSLIIAAYAGHMNTVELLLSLGAQVDAQCSNGRTALHHACEKSHLPIMAKLLSHSADIEKQDKEDYTPLFLGVMYEQTSTVQLLLAKGANPDARRSEDGDTPLMIAASRGDLELLCILLDSGAEIECRNDEGRTALMRSANAQITEKLLDAGADIEAKDRHSVNALMLAAVDGKVDVTKTLLAHGADMEERWEAGQTPLIIAAQSGHTNMVELLLEQGADVNALCNMNRSAVHYAAENGHTGSVRRLLSYAANINVQDTAGDTPLFLGLRRGHAEMVRLFLSIRDGSFLGERSKDSGQVEQTMGDRLFSQGAFDDALVAFQESLATDQRLFEADQDNVDRCRNLVLSHYNVGTIHKAQENANAMLAEYRQCVKMLESMQDRGISLDNQLMQFCIYLEESLTGKEFHYYDLENKAFALFSDKEYDESFRFFKRLETIGRANNKMDQVQRALNNMALILKERDGDLQGSMTMHEEQEAISREHNLNYGIALSLYNQAELLFEELQRREEALPKAREAFEKFETLGMKESADAAQVLIMRIERSM